MMNITTFNTNQIKTMSSLEIAELTGKQHKHVLEDIRKMLVELGKTAAAFTAAVEYEVNNGAKRTREVFNLPKDLTITLVSRYSYVASNIIINRWLELEGMLAADRLQNTQVQSLEMNYLAAKYTAEILNLPESGKLLMLQKIEKQYRLIDLSPRYGVDAIAGGSSSEVTKSLTGLLEGTGISPVKANKILIALGVLEELERPSSKGGIKKFKSLTKKGSSYGKNLTSPLNQRETQPHYFLSKREELLALLGDLS